jgi:hypothetical protein
MFSVWTHLRSRRVAAVAVAQLTSAAVLLVGTTGAHAAPLDGALPLSADVDVVGIIVSAIQIVSDIVRLVLSIVAAAT